MAKRNYQYEKRQKELQKKKKKEEKRLRKLERKEAEAQNAADPVPEYESEDSMEIDPDDPPENAGGK